LIDLNEVYALNGQVKTYKGIDVTQSESLSELDEEGRTKPTLSDESAKKYYQEAYEFTKWLIDNEIHTIVTPQNLIRDGGEYTLNRTQVLKFSNTNNEENLNSAFNQHKRDIMKLSIQDNLNYAVAKYDDNSQAYGTTSTFAVPTLSDEDWEKILNGVNMITFMQGIQVGTTVYNNYAIITSTSNKQYITGNEIYFIDNANIYHKINCNKIEGNITGYK